MRQAGGLRRPALLLLLPPDGIAPSALCTLSGVTSRASAVIGGATSRYSPWAVFREGMATNEPLSLGFQH